jgi:subtilisin family serine protease
MLKTIVVLSSILAVLRSTCEGRLRRNVRERRVVDAYELHRKRALSRTRRLSDNLDDLPDEVPVLIKYKNDHGRHNVLNVSNWMDDGLVRHNAAIALVPKGRIKELEDNDDIECVEKDDLMYRQGNFTPYGIRDVRGARFSSIPTSTIGACGDENAIRVAIIDDGLDAFHPDLACGDVSDPSSRRCYGRTWIRNSAADWSQPHDEHGTHVAGEKAWFPW